MLTQQRLKEVLSYDPDTGIWTWISRTSNRISIGDVAGNRAATGYIQIYVDGKNYTSHRLAFLYMTGEWPPTQVDHKDLDRTNNRWNNLRKASNSLNGANKRVRSDQKSQLPKGVYRNGTGFCARIQVNKKRIYIGQYNTPEAASEAYGRAAAQYFFEFGRNE